jgi:DNA-binding NarL/FixJ family response regulator
MRSTAQREGRGVRAPARTGLILLDWSRKPLYYNPEAIAVLSYPRVPQGIDSLATLLPEGIDSWLLRGESSRVGSASLEFLSGRRRYVCRAFTLVNGHSSRPPLTALLLERVSRESPDISELAVQFRLTQREQETVKLLTLGLTSKEIAAHMRISPNTVKCFMRLVMTKMAVNTRSGIVGKIARM